MAIIIIGIHGLGNKPSKKILEKWWKLAMIEGLKTNGYNIALPKFKLVYWADIMYDKPQSISEKNEDSPEFLHEKYIKATGNFPIETHSTRKNIVDFIGKQLNRIFLNKDLSLNYSYITDAIVRKYFKDLDIYYKQNCTIENEKLCRVKDLIRMRLINMLEKYKTDKIMLVSHSMGSIIAFDVLNYQAPNIPIDTFVTAGSPLGFPVVMSKIAAEQKQMFPHEVSMLTPQSITKNWYNFSDILDKVALNYKLADDFKINKNGVFPIDFLVVNNYEINGKRNPHKSYGYLRTPEFAKVLFEFAYQENNAITKKIISRILYYIDKVKNKFKKCNK